MINNEEVVIVNKKKKEEKKEEENIKKRGRKAKGEKRKFVLNREQKKFVVDLSKDKKSLEMVFNALVNVNNKNFGEQIVFRELAVLGISKLNSKDFEKLQKASISYDEMLDNAFLEYKTKSGKKISYAEFLVKELKLI